LNVKPNFKGIWVAVAVTLLAAGGVFAQTVGKVNITPAKGCYMGAYLYGIGWPDFIKKTGGKKFAISMTFLGFAVGNETFPKAQCEAYWALGMISDITMEPSTQKLQDIIDGKYDPVYKGWAAGVKEFGNPIFLRWGHEMNGDWYTWSGAKNGAGTLNGYGDPAKPDGPERYVAAFKRIHDIFDKEGATNVLWIWCPNIGGVTGAWNDIANYYPGDAYVDWIGMDGYNWGDANKSIGWKSFEGIYDGFIAGLDAINKDKPLIIGEFACNEAGGNKAEWILDAFEKIRTKYTRIKAFVWFNISKEAKWPLQSSPESREAFKKAMSDPYYLDKIQVN
jgi:beta-mannanase